VSRRRRIQASLKMTERLSTEDIEMLNEKFPRLVEEALNEILNEHTWNRFQQVSKVKTTKS
jgi:hypothetical protein